MVLMQTDPVFWSWAEGYMMEPRGRRSEIGAVVGIVLLKPIVKVGLA